ncbi:PorT family protein [Flavobacterium sp. ANB]|uniref:porin family protein n=1 Tax=unclassified Flavobacterium TaxID=196869 RepID=UPI0012B6F612|nr:MULTISPECIES: porin family protein [unclassified Flavobacterium]MBF4518859.1 PorT family protein [Flavobacterium sp. ANB]MTD71428.1 outer membrane beta-barrel protein [Flavobacterium sp. LC2016-13]
MRKIILSALAVMAFGLTNAQSTKFGVKGGLNLSTITGGNVEDNKSLVGFHVGGFAEIKIAEKFAIQPELLYSAQGSKFDGGPFFEDFDVKVDYLNIPVLAKYYIVEKFSVEAGPQLGILLSAKSEGEDVKDSFKSVDLGFNVGAGFQFTENLSINLRYTIGLSPISDNADIEDEEDYYDSAKNSNLALSLAYKF